MKNALLIGLVLLLVLSACSSARQKLSPQGNLNLKSANVYYQDKDNEKSLEKALNLYNRVLTDNPKHVIALKRTADINLFFASQLEPKKVEKDGKVEYQNMQNANKVIALFTITYGKYDSVLTVLNTFKDLKEDERSMKRDATRKKESSWVRMFKIGQYLYEQKRYDDAIPTFEMLYAMDNKRQEPLRMLVATYQETKNEAKFEEYVKKVLVESPDDAEMVNLMGAFYYNKQDYAKAVDYFKKVLVTRPLDTNNMLLLADTYLQMNELQLSYEMLQKVLKFEPDNLNVLTSAKDISAKMNNKDAELDYWKKILDLNPTTKVLEEYCFRMYNLQVFDNVMPYAEMWFQKDPTNKTAVSTCILFANKIGRKDLEKKYTDIYKSLQ